MQELIAKEIGAEEEGEVSYEIQWIIPNWREVREDVSLVGDQKAIFETGQQPTQITQTKWLVGLKDVPHPHGNGPQRVRVYWQLLDMKGWGSQFKLDAKLKTTLFCAKAMPYLGPQVDEQRHKVSLGDIIQEKKAFLDIGTDVGDVDDFCINANGSLEYTLVLTFKTADNDSTQGDFKRLKLEQFSKRSQALIRENMGTVLNDDKNGDLKIITSDGVELRAYQGILKVQCPVFAGMLNSDLSEAKTGILKMNDICGKTMGILLHYFYTGNLLNGCNDNETIVELTYAAGKYQITQVLELLDDLFGRGAQEEVSNLDVQLLNLAGKLSLKNAEARLLQRITGKITAAKKSEDVFQLFGYDGKDISRNAEMLADEKLGESKALEILNYTLGVGMGNLQLEHFFQSGLILLAFVQRIGTLRNLEQVLLKKFAEVTSTLASAEELFAFFGDGK